MIRAELGLMDMGISSLSSISSSDSSLSLVSWARTNVTICLESSSSWRKAKREVNKVSGDPSKLFVIRWCANFDGRMIEFEIGTMDRLLDGT